MLSLPRGSHDFREFGVILTTKKKVCTPPLFTTISTRVVLVSYVTVLLFVINLMKQRLVRERRNVNVIK